MYTIIDHALYNFNHRTMWGLALQISHWLRGILNKMPIHYLNSKHSRNNTANHLDPPILQPTYQMIHVIPKGYISLIKKVNIFSYEWTLKIGGKKKKKIQENKYTS